MSGLAYELGMVSALWQRDLRLFFRQRSRLLGVLLPPLLLWLAIGAGIAPSFRPQQGGPEYMEYFFPGVILVLLSDMVPETVKSLEPHETRRYLALLLTNLKILGLSFYALMGAALLDALLVGRGLPWVLARPLELICCLIPLPGGISGFEILALAGALDPWMQLRKPRPPPVGPDLESEPSDDDDLDLDLPF